MIRIIHHVYFTERCVSIADKQKLRIEKKIDSEYSYHRNIVNKDEHELHTLVNLLTNIIDDFNDDDFVLYLHSKGCTQPDDSQRYWREYMENQLIDNYKNHTKMLDIGFDTSGVLMGIPIWAENYYGGNFWWARVDSLKKIPKDYPWDMESRVEAENNFYQLIPNWNPYVYPIIDSESIRQVYKTFMTQINEGYRIRFNSN